MVDLRQTRQWGKWLAETGWNVDQVKTKNGGRALIFIRKMPFLPISFFKLQRFDREIDWQSLAEIKKRYRVLWSVMEPATEEVVPDIKKHGYRLTHEPYLPTKTRVLDLTKSESQLLAGMSENFRRVIKKGMMAKVAPISAEQFYAGWKRWSKSFILPKSQFDSLVKTFDGKPACRQAGVEFWAAEENGEILSAIMLLYTADACFYYQTWTSEAGRRGSHHVVLTWETMRRAKQMKKKYFNFEGIQDRRFPIARWDGFTEFKRRFGGDELAYPGSFLKWF